MMTVTRCPLRMTGGLTMPPPTSVPESFFSGPRVSGISVHVPLFVARTSLPSIATRCFCADGPPEAAAAMTAVASAATARAMTERRRFMDEPLSVQCVCEAQDDIARDRTFRI